MLVDSLALLGLILCIVTPRPRLPGLTLCGVYFIAVSYLKELKLLLRLTPIFDT